MNLDNPAAAMHTLTQIETDLAHLQNAWEDTASNWYEIQRDIRRAYARTLLTSKAGSVTEKKAEADLAALEADEDGVEAVHDALKHKHKLLESRAMICMAILKAQGRA